MTRNSYDKANLLLSLEGNNVAYSLNNVQNKSENTELMINA